MLNHKTKNPVRILVLRYSSLGDVILTNPVLDRLKDAYPKDEIIYATKKYLAPMVQYHPAVSGLVTLSGGGLLNFFRHVLAVWALKPDVVVDLHDSLRTRIIRLGLGKAQVTVYDKEGRYRRLIVKKLETKPSLHTVRKYLKALEVLGISSTSSVKCQVYVSKEDQKFADEYAIRHKIGKKMVIGFGPGATWKTKQWMPEYYAELASRWVKQYKAEILWFGNDKEVELIAEIQSQMTVPVSQRGLCVAGQLTLEQSSALLGKCHYFLGSDSGLIHLASARGVPVTVIYGSTTTSLGFEPWGKHQVAEVKGLDCRPCDVHGKKECPLGHFKCMKDLTPNKVENQMKKLMGKK
ncbi:MAG TPA: glycosyltransferase family 9 protein [bacterium]|jgi:lipopolysaccharide heptosyltransferase II|nr:glycosyltransferase family 9 protein [bacterium]